MKIRFSLVGWCLLFSAVVFETIESLLFSQYTVLQVVCAISCPVPYKNPLRKIFANWGFQFNYASPFSVSGFYKPTFFENPFEHRADDSAPPLQTDDESGNPSTTNGSDTITETFKENAPKHFRTARDNKYNNRNDLVSNDLTAGQLYKTIETNLFQVGYDQSCLMKSVCELARHPLHRENDQEEHLLMDIIHFLLTPTKHQGFTVQESYERQKYETAQKIGEDGDDCHSIYPECEVSLLNHISYLDPSM